MKAENGDTGKQVGTGTRYESVEAYYRDKGNQRFVPLKQNQVITLFNRKEKHFYLFAMGNVN